MQKNLLNNLLKEIVRSIAGKNSDAIVDILKEKKVNEFKIADKMKLTVNQVRNIFYKLHSYDVVIASRKKDKRKGWYIYSWSINIPKALEVSQNLKQKQIFEIEHTIKSRESKRFYFCENCKIEMTEESALNRNFFCPECGRLLQISSSEAYIKEQKQKLEQAKRELALIEQERQRIGQEREKKAKKIKKTGKAEKKMKKKIKKERKIKKKVKKMIKKAKKIKKKAGKKKSKKRREK